MMMAQVHGSLPPMESWMKFPPYIPVLLLQAFGEQVHGWISVSLPYRRKNLITLFCSFCLFVFFLHLFNSDFPLVEDNVGCQVPWPKSFHAITF